MWAESSVSPLGGLDVDDPPAEDVLGDDGPFDGTGVEILRVDDRLGLLGLDGLRQNGQRSFPTHSERDFVALLDVVRARPLRGERHGEGRRPQALDFPRFHMSLMGRSIP